MKLLTSMTFLIILASAAQSETWKCSVPYDEVNGGGTVTVDDHRLVFVSNWPHREPEVAKCIKTGLTSECMISSIAPTNAGGAAVFMKLYSIVWETGSGPKKIKVREPSVIFSSQEQGFEISDTFPAIGYAFPLVECQSD